MSLRFDGLLAEITIDQADARPVRHQIALLDDLTPYDLFNRDQTLLDDYQSIICTKTDRFFREPILGYARETT